LSIETCLQSQGLEGSEVSLSIVDDREMHELNLRYRGVDRTTDVLSFPLEEERPKEPCLLGDIIVSAPRAQQQAQEYGHSLLREMSFLVVHGTLHLLGYDHMTPAEDAEMQRLQEEVLSSLGITR
jgi:probable rRNA maturation factor